MNERLETAVRNIMSGNNECGGLANAAYNNDADYFRKMISPVFVVYEQESEELRAQRDSALREAENKRFALEFVAQNIGGSVTINDTSIMDAIRKALPGRMI